MASLVDPITNARDVLPPSALTPEAQINGNNFSIIRTGTGTKTTVQSEQPWHTLAAKYIAAGFSAKETAQMCECSPMMITTLLRNEWFAERVRNFMEKDTVPLTELFKTAALGAFATLVEINSNEAVSPSVRVAAAKEILDRHLGKSTQFMEVKATDKLSNAVEEVKKLEADVAREAQALNLLPPPPAPAA